MKQDQIKTIGGRYKLIQELNKGRWSKTYLAEDLGMPQRLKCIVKQLQLRLDDPVNLAQIKALWVQQATVWQMRVINNQITQLLACFEENNRFYLIQKYIEGETLATRLQKTPQISETQTISWLKEILSILVSIHQQGIVHGNLKPSNFAISLPDHRIVLIDFGLIHNLVERLIIQKKTTKLITEENSYYPQNLVNGRQQQAYQADFYAVGIMAIQMLAGIDPAKLMSPPVVKAIFKQENCKLSRKLVNIIERMITLDAPNCYTSAEEIITDLNQINSPTKNIESKNSKLIATTSIISSELQSKIKTAFNRIYQQPKYFVAVVIAILALGGMGELLFPTIRPFYHIWQGKKQLSEDPKTALKSFQEAIKINSQSTSAWKNRGDALFYLERYRAAIAAYDKALQISPNNSQVWAGRGEALYRLERFEAAVTAYDKALQLSPKDVAVLNRKGRALYKLERYPDALAAQEQALRLKPDYVNAMKDRGVALLGMGKHEEAMVAFNNAQAFDPLNPELWQNRALALQYINQPQEAMRLYQEAVEAYDKQVRENPKNITAILDKANVLGKLQQHQQALLAYEQALTVNPDSHLALLGKGNTLFALRKYEEALAAFDRALKLQPKSYLTWHNRGSLLQDGLRNLPEAIASYERSTEINPSFYHAWRDRGVALSQIQQHQEALNSFKKALNIQPNDYKSWVARGITLSSLDRNDEAIASFDRAVEIQPHDPFVLMNRAAALEKSQRYTEACDVYRQLKQINPQFSPAIRAMNNIGCVSTE
ncbi:tetratricopeptide repeat protein [Pleurocapsa sp. PCC 7319]|uniref:tetratricopeptide repeat protein n=1 Tax=Pleurocapsa sp. PCC 7319 TaxID=118161 RepID=UPI00034BD8AF|nr:tetratricopeptide repeat protein [Pleurocapsa sp. PCC 7319]